MRLYPIKTRIIKTGDNLVEIVLGSLRRHGLRLEDNDTLVLTSKVISYAEGRIAKLSEIKPSPEAIKLARRFSMLPEFAELVLLEGDAVRGGVEKAVLTLRNGMLVPNAGVDNKNAPAKGFVVLWPSNAEQSAKEIREKLKLRTGRNVAVMIIDSGLKPLRKGTTGSALAVAGFRPVIDHRGEKDLRGREIAITTHSVADDLASAAHLLMGEAAESTPIVLIRDAPLEYTDGVYGSADMAMPADECIFTSAHESMFRKKRASPASRKPVS